MLQFTHTNSTLSIFFTTPPVKDKKLILVSLIFFPQ